jgi:hypothetical protein
MLVFVVLCSFEDCFCIWVGNFIPLDSISKSNLTYFPNPTDASSSRS